MQINTLASPYNILSFAANYAKIEASQPHYGHIRRFLPLHMVQNGMRPVSTPWREYFVCQGVNVSYVPSSKNILISVILR